MKTALITGASRGIGAALAEAFAEAGWAVAVNYNKSREAAEQLVSRLTAAGHTAAPFQADVGDPEAVRRLVADTEDRLGSIDLLVNNAGLSHHGLLTDLSDADWQRLLAVNLSGALYCCRAVLPGMIRRQSGTILNISSMWGQIGGSCEVAYSATKAGLIGLTKALAQEVGPSGVRVNCIAPGVIATDMTTVLGEDTLAALADETPLCRVGLPREVAAAALYLASPAAAFVTGQVLAVNGGIC
ncbi:MAG: 3-oxoacyl-ACP reductase FabG [Clostridia bacterium]|nr:3-oxoacyl-ACP reductase FabG [Clostridia bacterium]